MTQENKAIVEKVNEAFAANQPEVFLSYCSDDVVWRMVGDRRLEGKAAIQDFMSTAEGIEPPAFEVDEIISGGDAVVCYGDMKMKGEDGQEGDYSYCDIYRFEDGKITELQSFVVKHNSAGETSSSAAA